MQTLWKERFLDIFPVPHYLSLGTTACAIDHDTVRFIELVRGRYATAVRRFGTVVLPQAFDKSLRDPQSIKGPIAATLSRAGVRNVSLVIPEQSAYVFITHVPLAEAKLVREAISFKLEEHVPVALADASFEYDVVGTDAVKNAATVAVRVVPRQYMESLIAIFSSPALLVTGCDTESKALARALSPKDGSTCLIIHIGRASTVFVIATGGAPLFSSTLSVGSIEVSLAVGKVFSVQTSEIPDLRVKLRSSTAPDPRLFDALVPTLAAIRDEANKVTDYWNSHTDETSGSPIASVLLSGEDAVFSSVMAYLELSFSIPIGVADVWRNAGMSADRVPPIEFAPALGFAAVIGAAVGATHHV